MGLSQLLQKAKPACMCVRKRDIERANGTQGKKRIKVFVHRKGWDYKTERRFVQFEVILHFCPHLILNLFYLFSFPAIGWKKSGINNQRLATAGEFLLTLVYCTCMCRATVHVSPFSMVTWPLLRLLCKFTHKTYNSL